MTAHRGLGTGFIVGLVVLVAIIASMSYWAWANYLSFYNSISYFPSAVDWSSFTSMILGVVVLGFSCGLLSGFYLTIRAYNQVVEARIEREKLKEEIKKELEMERQKQSK